jgi:tRNA A-37 threonylcarbamoyl transferase component Bud32
VAHSREQLLQFESRQSLDAEAVALVNDRLGTQAAFVAVVERGDWLTPSRCPAPDQLHVEVRRLAGARPPGVQILANAACVTGSEAALTTWNYKAAGVWLAVLLVLARPVLRGWGKVEVRVKLPDQTRALFSISLTRRPRKVKAKGEGEEGGAQGRFNQKLRALGRKERPLRRSGKLTFGWVPARKAAYYVTIRGPLFHSISEELIGDFLEERTVTVARGRTATVGFDLAPKDCPVEVMVYHGTQALHGAQIAVRGDPRSVRFTSNGSAFLYLPKGRHVLVAGARDRAAEREIHIESFEPKPVVIDLAAEGGLVFQGCEAAVTPFLEGNFDAAALALREVGQDELARLMQARAHESRGELEEASRLLEQAGQVTQAADMLARSGSAASASLYEEAGEFGRAAEIHQASGDMLAAARAWEAAYEYENAIECYRQLGDVGQVLALLEKSGDYYEAGRLSVEQGEIGRAIQNLQQVEPRHPHYGDACRVLGDVLAEQGNRDFALEKLDEARAVSGLEAMHIALRERYGRMLEDAGRLGDAIEVLSSVRREDIGYRDVDERIAALKQRLTEIEAERAEAATRVATPAAATDVAPGAGPAIDDRYEIEGQIGAGGMGVVFKARDKQLGRMVALKRLPENLSQHPAAVKFFEREARSAAALNHPNIVTVYDAGRANGQYFITMELLEGTPLDAIAKKHGALPPLVVAQLGVQIATGLHFAHRNKIIHRDIKPANLFLTRDKIVKIMDFGLAKMVEEARKGATVVGGTPYYLAPEQAAGDEVDHRADLYALGVTLYQLASGGLPFTEGDVAHHHRHTPPPDPREFNSALPAPLAELILKLIEKRPEDRIQRAADVVRALQAFIDASAARRA